MGAPLLRAVAPRPQGLSRQIAAYFSIIPISNVGLCPTTDGVIGTHILAEAILEPLWQANPQLHGYTMARILWTSALISEMIGRTAEACVLG
jgi:hypothetical protein